MGKKSKSKIDVAESTDPAENPSGSEEDLLDPKDGAAPSPDEGELSSLRERAAQLEKEAAEFKDLALRARAELENYRKRVARERSESLRFSEQQLLVDLLPVLDDFNRALQATPETEEGQSIRAGLDMVKKSWEKVLREHDVVEMSTRGEAFDPALHEAISRLEREDLEPNTVVEEYRKGFLLHDRVIRAAQVVVSHRTTKTTPPASEDTPSADGGANPEN